MMFFYVLPCSCCFFFLVLFYFIIVLYFFYVSLPQVNTTLDVRGKIKQLSQHFMIICHCLSTQKKTDNGNDAILKETST